MYKLGSQTSETFPKSRTQSWCGLMTPLIWIFFVEYWGHDPGADPGISDESSAIHRLWEPPIDVEDVVRKWILSQSISVEVVVGESIFRILGISDESSAIHGYYTRTPELLNTKICLVTVLVKSRSHEIDTWSGPFLYISLVGFNLSHLWTKYKTK